VRASGEISGDEAEGKGEDADEDAELEDDEEGDYVSGNGSDDEGEPDVTNLTDDEDEPDSEAEEVHARNAEHTGGTAAAQSASNVLSTRRRRRGSHNWRKGAVTLPELAVAARATLGHASVSNGRQYVCGGDELPVSKRYAAQTNQKMRKYFGRACERR
jgi:hypothetical protein